MKGDDGGAAFSIVLSGGGFLTRVAKRSHPSGSLLHRTLAAIAELLWSTWLELDPEEMVGGFPEYNEDGSVFDDTEFAKCVKEIWPLACKLA